MKGEDYRDALARYVTADPQFARAAVNYIWAQLFGLGISSIRRTSSIRLRLGDPNNPPPAPWTSCNPPTRICWNGLAQQFISSGYNVKALIRTIVNSDTYQLSSAYDNTWQDSWEPYFARKLVRRLWSEEVHDAVVTAINTLPSYTVPEFLERFDCLRRANSPGFGKINYAMQAPDVVNMPDGGGSRQPV